MKTKKDNKNKTRTHTPLKKEVIQVRLDPKLKFSADIAARVQRRKISSFVQWAIARTLKTCKLEDGEMVLNVVHEVWSVNEHERFINLAIKYPSLLNFEEEKMWKCIKDESNLCIKGLVGDQVVDVDMEKLDKKWDAIKLKADQS